MTAKIASRTAQYPLVATFTFTIGDTMTNAAGTADAFATAAAHAFDVIPLPVNAVVIGGSITTDTAFVGSTAYNVIVGDATTTNRYLTTTDKTTAATTALVPTGYISDGGNIRLTVTPTVATATAGKISLRVEYVIDGRANETQIT